MSFASLPKEIWNDWLERPFPLVKEYLGVDLSTDYSSVIFKVVVILMVLLIVFEAFHRIKDGIQKLFGSKDWLEVDDVELPNKSDVKFVDTIEAARNLDKTIKPLKAAKKYDRVAEVYASFNMHKDAAKWFEKARDRGNAANEWALAGYTLKAAKLLMKEGDYANAARFFAEKGDYKQAAAAYRKQGDLPGAASAYSRAGKADLAARMFEEYFEANADATDAQLRAAEACYAMLREVEGGSSISPERVAGLIVAVAERFELAQRHDVAADLFEQAGEYDRAGRIFLQTGKMDAAARCLRAAGDDREAGVIDAKLHEARGAWSDAGMAYGAAGDFRKAGECFTKAKDWRRAAECYERVGEFYGAGLARRNLKQYDQAIPLLQNIRESDKLFDLSRALLGQCFYELHDYEHCVAALDNHLTGKRVETSNIDYFYMLALAYEQLGKLEESQRLLYKIQSVNVSYRDVALRLKNISSRISIAAGVETPLPRANAKTEAEMDPERTQVMQMVEGLLGGRYRLEREIGRGGMGVVYLARDMQLDRPVALKFLGTLMDESEEYRERFIREAKVAAKVNHPNIVSIYDVSASMGRARIVMEYVQGASLSRRIKEKGKLAPREALNVFAQACSALNAIHKAGIVHRDIKPDNLLIAQGGLVKLTDFGLAKAESSRITATNVVMGTPSFMSPEQARGEDVDARSDIYSMGLVLHQMLTGTAFFSKANIMERRAMDTPPPPSEQTEEISPELDAFVLKCLANEQSERFQTVSEMISALRTLPAV
jgi:tetratricopeptide (TPR) repeat protein